MRRWVLAFLLCVLPFQFIWATAAPYCAHETSSSAKKHFGHHEHRHQAGADVTKTSDDNGDGPGAYHADCVSCHLGCSATLPTPPLVFEASPERAEPRTGGTSYTSHVPSGPERPDRIDINAAARFGGDVAQGPNTI